MWNFLWIWGIVIKCCELNWVVGSGIGKRGVIYWKGIMWFDVFVEIIWLCYERVFIIGLCGCSWGFGGVWLV